MSASSFPRRTREDVLAWLAGRIEQKLPLNSGAVQKNRELRPFYSAALRIFGSWDETLRAAGVEPESVRKARPAWTEEEIVQFIQNRHKNKEPVNAAAILKVQSGAYQKAVKLFDSWDAALEAAGLNPEAVREIRQWSADIVQSRIQERRANKQPLNSQEVQGSEAMLYHKAREYFGSWEQALSAAGIQPDEVRKKRIWSSESVISAIQARNAEGLEMNALSIMRDDHPLFKAARRRFEGWDGALRAAGLDAEAIRRKRENWSEPDIIAEIQRLREAGEELNASAVQDSNSGLIGAAVRLLGSWDQALRAAGLDPDEVRLAQPWNAEKVIREIQEREGKAPLNTRAVQLTGTYLYRAGVKHFGSWDEALRAAGLDPEEVRLQGPVWTEERILAAVGELHEAGLPVNYTRVREVNAALAGAGKRLLGWDQVVLRLGLDPDEIRVRQRPRSPEEVIRHIQMREQDGAPLHASVVKIEMPGLHASAVRHFGSWDAAIAQAGLDPATVRLHRPDWTQDALVEEIQGRWSRKEPVHASGVSASLLNAGIRLFGSWDESLQAAGLDPEEIRRSRRWSEADVVGEIQRADSRDAPLNASAMDSNLRVAAIRLFGSWDDALIAAGVDPSLHRVTQRAARFGMYFEEVAREIFSELRPHWDQNYRHVREGLDYQARPDCMDPTTGEWIDFKLCDYGSSAQSSVEKYTPLTQRLRFICLDQTVTSLDGIPCESFASYEAEARTEAQRLQFRRGRELLELWKSRDHNWEAPLEEWMRAVRAERKEAREWKERQARWLLSMEEKRATQPVESVEQRPVRVSSRAR